MNEITIQLNNLQDVKIVNIKDVGVLKVRRLGSGEDLDLSFKRRRINKLIDELNTIDFSGLDAKKPSDLKKMEKLSKHAEILGDEIADIKQSEFDIYKGLLSDDKNGEVVDVVMNTLTDKQRAELFLLAFGEKKQIETPEPIKTEDEETNE